MFVLFDARDNCVVVYVVLGPVAQPSRTAL